MDHFHVSRWSVGFAKILSSSSFVSLQGWLGEGRVATEVDFIGVLGPNERVVALIMSGEK